MSLGSTLGWAYTTKNRVEKKDKFVFFFVFGEKRPKCRLIPTKKGEKKVKFVFFAFFGGKKGRFRGPKFDFKY